jgi:hypothetical protein
MCCPLCADVLLLLLLLQVVPALMPVCSYFLEVSAVFPAVVLLLTGLVCVACAAEFATD